MRTWLPLWAIGVLLPAGVLPAQELWWQRGADKWYYKDDWKGLAVTAVRGGRGPAVTKTVALPGAAGSGWIVVWGDRGYRLSVNDREVATSIDGCLIDDHDLTPFVAGADKVVLRIDGRRVCAEGEIVTADGRRQPFATGDDWQGAAGGAVKTEKVPAGPSTGAYHRAHNGRLMTHNEAERGKTAIAKALARIQKLAEQGVFLMKRYRPAGEILSFDGGAPWRRAERIAAPLVAGARAILSERAIPAQKAGRFAEAIAAAGEAATLIAAAEAPVQAAADLYRAEREAAHLDNVAAIVGLPAGQDVGELRSLAASARADFALGDWASAAKALRRLDELARDLRARIEAAAANAGRPLVGGAGQADEFPEDRFAWLNARELMGGDPANWPFSVCTSTCPYIDLAGLWLFRTDPNNVGEKAGWPGSPPGPRWRNIAAPGEWERQGITQDNRSAPGAPIGRGTTGRDKPYNGFAWYRKAVHVPAGWRGRPLRLTLGHVANWARVFLNGKPVGVLERAGEGRQLEGPSRMAIPAESIEFGRPNTIAVQVYNHDNFGGLVAGPLALHVEGVRSDLPGYRGPDGEGPDPHAETPGPLSYARELACPDGEGLWRQATVAGAMSPAAIVACNRPRIELWGWRAKGYEPPEAVSFAAAGGMRTVKLDKPGRLAAGADLAESWLLVRGQATCALIVPARRPAAVAWENNAQEAMSLVIDFDGDSARAAVLCMPPAAGMDEAACRFWAKALRYWPVMASECVTPAAGAAPAKRGEPGSGADGPARHCTIRYSYVNLDGSPAAPAPAQAVAPLPMLASFALAGKYPGLSVHNARPTGYASQYCPYLVVEGSDRVAYDAPAVDRTKVMKGVGELFARKTAAGNVHGGLGEREMFQRQADWGFDHNRYALAFDAEWDLPLVKPMGGPVTDDEALWKRLDELVANCNDAGMQMMLCSFPEIESRRWTDNPEQERRTLEFWRRIAHRYARLPRWAISYDFFNEPAYVNTDHWNRLMRAFTRTVRSVDKTHTLVWESADGWAQPFWCLWMQPVDDDNVIYSFHHYGKHWGYAYDEYYPGYQATAERMQIDAWLEAILFGLRHHVDIHCGEFGISMIQPDDDGERWLNDYLAMFERFGIGWNWWNYSGDNIYRTGLAAGDRVSPYVPILRKWIQRSGWGIRKRRGLRD